MAFAKTLIRALHLLGQHICFSEHGRAPRWTLRDALASFAIGKMRESHGPAFLLSFALLSRLSGRWQAGFASRVAAGTPSSSSSRPLFMYVNVPGPTPKNWLVKYSILTYFVPSVASLLSLEDDDGPVM